MNTKDKKQEKVFIAMGFDPLFKKMFGDINYTNKAAALVSIVLNIPYCNIKDNVEIINNERIRRNKQDKKQEKDVLLRISLQSENQFIDLEANLFGYNQELIDRNTSYISNIYSDQLKESDDYSLLKPVIQINFNKPTEKISSRNPYKPIDTYLLRNEDCNVLTNMIKIINVDIVKCYKLWYNGGIKKFTSCEQNIIRLGALHYINDDEVFRKCLGEIVMDEEVKSKIQRDMDEYQHNKSLVRVYNIEKRLAAERAALERELDNKKIQLDNKKIQLDKQEHLIDKKKQQIDKDKQQIDKDKQQIDKDKQQIDKDKQQIDKDKQQIDIDRLVVNNEQIKLFQEKINIAKILKNTGVSIDEISNRLNISIDDIIKNI